HRSLGPRPDGQPRDPGQRAAAAAALTRKRPRTALADRPRARQVARDVLLVRLDGAAADLEQLRVAPQALDAILADVAVPAEDLDRAVGHLLRHGGAEELDAVRVDARAGSGQVERRGDLVDVAPTGHEAGIGVGDVALDLPELVDRLPEGLPLRGVC